MSSIGKDTKILDGQPKVVGAMRFASDIERPGILHARFVTSPYAHADLGTVDVAAAGSVPGVVRILTAADLPPIPPTSRPLLLLARDRVVFAGQPVALVLAENARAAQDAADLVQVDYQPKPSFTDLETGLSPDAPAVWPQGLPGQSAEAAAHGAAGGSGGGDTPAAPNLAHQAKMGRGDVETGLRESDVVLDRTFTTAPVHQSYLEPHVTVVDPDPVGAGMTVYTCTQAPYFVRDAVSGVLGLEKTQIRVVGTPVGGGFGAKFVLYEPLVALAVRLTGLPVKLELTRLEEMLAATPAPATRVRVRLGAKNDGTFHALDAEMVMDNGCFPASMSGLAGILLGSQYKVPHLSVRGMEVLSFRPSAGAYRAPAAPQAAFALESIVDEMAAELGRDPLELRQQNAAAPGDPMASGAPWPSMGLAEVLAALEHHPAWQNRAQARQAGRGVGIAVGGWPGGTEPATAACSLQPDGTVQINLGTADITGTDTSMALIAAEAFGIEADRVRVVKGDTASAPFAGSSGGSKIVYTVGPAVIMAAEEARRQTLALAAETFEADPEDLEIRDGNVQVKGSPDKAVSLAKIAQRTMRFGAKQAPVYGHGRHAQQGPSPGFCAQLAEVEVDPETGAVRVHRLVVVQDAGKAINPAAVRGQMAGGAVQGLGWALLEQLAYDEDGQLLTATFNDYAIPHSIDVPDQLELEIVEVPSPVGPFGARGVGEPPVIPTAAAVANAIADVAGVRARDLPITAPRLRKLLS